MPIIINDHFHLAYMSRRHVVIMSLQWGLSHRETVLKSQQHETTQSLERLTKQSHDWQLCIYLQMLSRYLACCQIASLNVSHDFVLLQKQILIVLHVYQNTCEVYWRLNLQNHFIDKSNSLWFFIESKLLYNHIPYTQKSYSQSYMIILTYG